MSGGKQAVSKVRSNTGRTRLLYKGLCLILSRRLYAVLLNDKRYPKYRYRRGDCHCQQAEKAGNRALCPAHLLCRVGILPV